MLNIIYSVAAGWLVGLLTPLLFSKVRAMVKGKAKMAVAQAEAKLDAAEAAARAKAKEVLEDAAKKL